MAELPRYQNASAGRLMVELIADIFEVQLQLFPYRPWTKSKEYLHQQRAHRKKYKPVEGEVIVAIPFELSLPMPNRQPIRRLASIRADCPICL